MLQLVFSQSWLGNRHRFAMTQGGQLRSGLHGGDLGITLEHTHLTDDWGKADHTTNGSIAFTATVYLGDRIYDEFIVRFTLWNTDAVIEVWTTRQKRDKYRLQLINWARFVDS